MQTPIRDEDDAVRVYNKARALIAEGYVEFDRVFRFFSSRGDVSTLKAMLNEDDVKVWVKLEELKESLRGVFGEVDDKQKAILNENVEKANVILPENMTGKTLEELLVMKRGYNQDLIREGDAFSKMSSHLRYQIELVSIAIERKQQQSELEEWQKNTLAKAVSIRDQIYTLLMHYQFEASELSDPNRKPMDNPFMLSIESQTKALVANIGLKLSFVYKPAMPAAQPQSTMPPAIPVPPPLGKQQPAKRPPAPARPPARPPAAAAASSTTTSKNAKLMAELYDQM
jgi:hypothetical protein